MLSNQDYSIPWKAIVTSLPVQAIIAAHFATNWMTLFMQTELPLFLTHVLDYRVDQVR
jgi:hypothetical protein